MSHLKGMKSKRKWWSHPQPDEFSRTICVQASGINTPSGAKLLRLGTGRGDVRLGRDDAATLLYALAANDRRAQFEKPQ